MPLNTSIAMGFQSPQFESPINMMGNALKLKSMQQQNALAEQQMTDLETARGNTTLLDSAYQKAVKPDGSIDYGVVLAEVAKGGKGSLLPGLLKTRAETEDAATKAKTSKVELVGKTLDFRRGFLRPDMPADQLIAWSNGNFKDELLGPELMRMGLIPEKVDADIMAAANSGTLPNYIRQAAQGIDALKLTFVQRDSGGAVETLAMDATGRNAFVVPGSTTQKTLSPAEKARLDAETQTGAFSEDSVDLMAGLVAQGYQLPITLGRGSKSDALKNTIMERAGRIARGLSPRPTAPAPAGTRPSAAPAAPAAPAASAVEVAATIGGARQDQQSVTGAMRYYSSGRGNQIITSLNTAVDHLDTLSELSSALGNGDVKTFNRIGQAFKKEFGQDAPTNLDAAKVVIAREVLKAITATGGGVVEAQELQSTMDKTNSFEQLAGTVKTLQELLAGQLNSIGTQYKATTKRDDFDERLSDRTKRVLGRGSNADGGDEKINALLIKYEDKR